MPAAVGERAEALGITTTRSFGSTEHPSITGMHRRRRRARSGCTPTARRCPASSCASSTRTATTSRRATPGEIWSRGPDCFVGYTDPALTAQAFAAGGWFMTGDIGVLDADGYLAITDRKKDIIIRGGENVSAAEVEEQLRAHARVSRRSRSSRAPDPRLGERGCAFVRMQPGADAPDLEAVRAHLEARRPGAPEVARGRACDRRVPAHARAARSRSSCCASGS